MNGAKLTYSGGRFMHRPSQLPPFAPRLRDMWLIKDDCTQHMPGDNGLCASPSDIQGTVLLPLVGGYNRVRC